MTRVAVLGSILGVGLFTTTTSVVVAEQAGKQLSGAAEAVQAMQSPVRKIEKVAGNLYMIRAAGGNTAVFVTANGVVLVDTKFAKNGQALLNQVKTVTDKPITHIINTHTHADHTGSNAEFPASVETITQENTAANMRKMPVFQEAANKHGLPDRTFKDKITVLGGNDAIDLYYFGPAHTNGDTLVVFRNAHVMHTGDTFPAKAGAFVDLTNGGSGLAFSSTIAKAVAGIQGVDTIIPGHGMLMKWQDYVGYGEFMGLFVDHARASFKAGKTPAQAVADFKLPDKFKDYDLSVPQDGGLAEIYAELKQR